MPDTPAHRPRPLRSDAAANRDRLLAAAAVAIRRDGEKVPMAQLAAQAGVGVGTLYRHFPTRAALLDALAQRAYEAVLGQARAATQDRGPVPDVIERFLQQTIAARDDLILPLHGGPVSLDRRTAALRTEISDLLEQVLERGRRDGTVRADVSAIDVIITGAMLAQPLPNVPGWDRLALRQAKIFVAGLACTHGAELPGARPTRAQMEAGFAAKQE